jgi:ribonuclease D
MHIEFITTRAALQTACDQFSQSPVICVDTEFHRESTYYPQLALIQIADNQRTVCIDPLALDDLQPLLPLFTNPGVLKVFHAASQDMEIFHHTFGQLPMPVFDTQIAAALLGYGDQIGYAALIQETLGVEVDKSQTRTDWMQRPLSEKQIQYAGSDVFYLNQMYPRLAAQLRELHREDWLREDFAELSDPQTYTVQPENLWRKIKMHQRLRGIELAILQRACAWRERTAQQRDKPRKRIVSDDVLIDLARQQPESPAQLFSLRSLQGARLSQDDAQALLQCIEQARQLPKEQWPKLPKIRKLTEEDDALVDILSALLKQQAAQYRIHPTSLASRKHLEALVQGERDIPLLHSWRLPHGGQMLLDFLEGKLSLAMADNKLRIKPQH